MPSIRQYELKIRRVEVADAHPVYGRTVHGPADVADIARALIGDAPQEVFLVFHLSVRNRILGYTEVGRGGIDYCPVDPRIVFAAALAVGAHAIILAHNHPSGNPAPSGEDRALTERIARGAEVLGLALLDHVVVTHDDACSVASDSTALGAPSRGRTASASGPARGRRATAG